MHIKKEYCEYYIRHTIDYVAELNLKMKNKEQY